MAYEGNGYGRRGLGRIANFANGADGFWAGGLGTQARWDLV